MKRTGQLLPRIVDPDNLRLAFYKAARTKAGQSEVEDFRSNLDSRLIQLRGELLDGNITIGDYHYFKIYDPKERVICAASFRERVLHHALMNVCHPVFERFQIYHSYATRPGKGTFAALEYAKGNSRKFEWFLKLDIRKYFDSISHRQLNNLLQRKIKDGSVLKLFARIIESYEVKSGYGLPIGNLTSQYFANYYLAWLDHFIQEDLKHGAYVRYMDDMVLWASTRKELLGKATSIRSYLKENLELDLKTCLLNHNENGLLFLGFRLQAGRILLARRTKLRFRKKAQQYQKWLQSGKWDEKSYQRHILPLLSFIQKADSHSWRNSLLSDIDGYNQGL